MPASLDPLLHEPLRLRLVAALAREGPLTFGALKDLLATSSGNLSVHARKLEDAGFLSARKSFEGRVPRTVYRLTPRGRGALKRYAAGMRALLGGR